MANLILEVAYEQFVTEEFVPAYQGKAQARNPTWIAAFRHAGEAWGILLGAYSIPISLASVFHLPSTRAFVFSSIRISSGQGRLKPSLGHLRVASMPIFEP